MPPTPDPVAPVAHQYRGDIDGLRAISILAVVLYHAGVEATAGGYVGVDVFFVVSGFLITGLLAREVEKTGRISLRDFYARRIRRLLPLSAATLVGTILAGVWLLPPTAREGLVDDARAATLYIANWRYAAESTTYSDTEVTDSLLVHYWSLAIEEQFYVLWPLLIVSGVALARIFRRPAPQALGALLAATGIVSFILSVVITNRDGVGAYYLTHTRLWEMAAGAGLALTIPRLPALSTASRNLVATGGLIAIAVAVATFDETTAFPGSAALLPVAGSLGVLLAGVHGPTTAGRVLSLSPFRLVGRLSYAWYLLHWPAIGIALLLRNRYDWSAGPGAVTAAAVVTSLVLAWVAHHAIENPVRFAAPLKRGWRPNFVLGIGLTVTPLIVGVALLSTVDVGDRTIVVAGPDGAIALTQTPAQAAADSDQLDSRCHAAFAVEEPLADCVFGDPDGDKTLVLLGDSHARQWIDVLDLIGREDGWKVYSWTKSACSIFDQPIELTVQSRPYVECDRWRTAVAESVAGLNGVDTVLLARANYRDKLMVDGSLVSADDSPAIWEGAVSRTVSTFSSLADDVIVLSDTPWPGFAAPDCLSASGASSDDCSFTIEASRRDASFIAVETELAETLPFRTADPFPLVCERDRCGVVTNDGLIKYRDSHHLTRTFTLSLADDVRRWLEP